MSHAAVMTPDEALTKLMEGNKRYLAGKAEHPHQDAARRQEVLGGQSPFAIVVTCSDSRVPPEVFFDAGIGDIFVIRVAGNVVGDVMTGSIEYAAEHLGTPLVMVLGHDKCGAVKATIDGGDVPPNIGRIAALIAPAVETAKGQPGDLFDNAIWNNVTNMVAAVKNEEPVMKHLVHEGKVKVVGARYHLDSGEVELAK
jgi:carbonic anhydrase